MSSLNSFHCGSSSSSSSVGGVIVEDCLNSQPSQQCDETEMGRAEINEQQQQEQQDTKLQEEIEDANVNVRGPLQYQEDYNVYNESIQDFSVHQLSDDDEISPISEVTPDDAVWNNSPPNDGHTHTHTDDIHTNTSAAIQAAGDGTSENANECKGDGSPDADGDDGFDSDIRAAMILLQDCKNVKYEFATLQSYAETLSKSADGGHSEHLFSLQSKLEKCNSTTKIYKEYQEQLIKLNNKLKEEEIEETNPIYETKLQEMKTSVNARLKEHKETIDNLKIHNEQLRQIQFAIDKHQHISQLPTVNKFANSSDEKYPAVSHVSTQSGWLEHLKSLKSLKEMQDFLRKIHPGLESFCLEPKSHPLLNNAVNKFLQEEDSNGVFSTLIKSANGEFDEALKSAAIAIENCPKLENGKKNSKKTSRKEKRKKNKKQKCNDKLKLQMHVNSTTQSYAQRSPSPSQR